MREASESVAHSAVISTARSFGTCICLEVLTVAWHCFEGPFSAPHSCSMASLTRFYAGNPLLMSLFVARSWQDIRLAHHLNCALFLIYFFVLIIWLHCCSSRIFSSSGWTFYFSVLSPSCLSHRLLRILSNVNYSRE
jgi:hypothetical protein